MFFADRLKALGNSIDSVGTNLQAQGRNLTHSPSASSPTAEKVPSRTESSPTRPTAGLHHTASSSTSLLAENALSGLRKSFQLNRGSVETKLYTLGSGDPNHGQQELKDLPPSPVSSPARLFTASHFGLGSLTPSVAGTPRLRTPPPAFPPPNPEDPSTFPLPPSPVILPVSLGPSAYADPLGASPLIIANDPADPPRLDIELATPDAKDSEDEDLALVIETKTADGVTENGDEGMAEKDVDGVSAKKVADMERRYEDLSQRFTTLLSQTHGANKVLKELTPLEGGIQDFEALDGWVRMVNVKVEMSMDELRRLQDKIRLQDSRMEELRDTHRLEASSQTDLVAKLRTQLSTAETNLSSKASDLLQLSSLRSDLAKAQTTAKEEEEKRTKAISLLKTVRMKLVKVEKEKEEIEKDRAEERAERSRAGEEVEKVKAEREREVTALRKGFERELASAKERYEKDVATKKAAWELEMITTKASHAKDLSTKSTKISGLEAIVKELSATKQSQFNTLQSRQAEVETARAEMESLQTRTKELEFQLREASERCALLEDNASDTKRKGRISLGVGMVDRSPSPSPSRSRGNSASQFEVQRLLAEAEARSEAKLSDLRARIRTLENERNEAEEEWGAKLGERVRELEKLRRAITEKESEYAESLRTRREKEVKIEEGEEKRRLLERDILELKEKVEAVKGDVGVAAEGEKSARDEIANLQAQIVALQSQVDDAKSHAAQLKANNKTIREELRKVQSSVQLMERSRNPGVGYWAGGSGGAGVLRSGIASPDAPGTPTRELRRSLESVVERSSEVSAGDKNQEEEEVNLEYLRNVILQFLEHKEMRPNLVRVLSVILRFTPQELRRLNAKLLS
ncbi:hypothetical protein P7C73_g3070, partial [Tremellales sp. Uapishka_1]